MEIPEIITLSKKNITDFALERNLLLSKAKKEWVLFIDSDEIITNYQLPITNQFSNYKIKRNTFFLGKYVGSDYPIRLVKKGTGRWERQVHEVWQTKKPVGVLNNTVITHNTADNLSEYINKINNYSDLHALANKEEKKTPSVLKIIFYPLGKFIFTLFHSRNMVFSIMQAFHSYLSWSKLYFLPS